MHYDKWGYFGREKFDKEKTHYSLARLKRDGEQFEILIDADKAASYKNRDFKRRKGRFNVREDFFQTQKTGHYPAGFH